MVTRVNVTYSAPVMVPFREENGEASTKSSFQMSPKTMKREKKFITRVANGVINQWIKFRKGKKWKNSDKTWVMKAKQQELKTKYRIVL